MSTPKKPAAAAAPVEKEQANPVKATERDTPVLIPDSVAPENEVKPTSVATEVTQAPEADPLEGPITATVNIVQSAAKVEKPQGKTVKVKFLRSHPAFGHFAGDEAEISQESFDKYSQDGPFFEKI